MMRVPFLDVAAGIGELRTEIDAAIARVLDGGRYILGPEVGLFEEEWAAHVGASHCVGVGNGLDALRLALMAMGVGPGDEVIVPANTFIATWLAVSQTGAIPVPVEPDSMTGTLDPTRVIAALTSRTRAIVPVHLYGHPADLNALEEIARARSLWLLDDAAQAHGARLDGDPIGSRCHATAWSFYPGKNLGALGDGGAVTTSDPELAARVRRLGNYGSPVKYRHDVQGVNSRLDELQAAVLRVKLAHLDEWNARRRGVAARYLAGLGGLTLRLPAVAPGAEPVWHLFVVRSQMRDRIAARLSTAGVETLVHYPIPPHRQEAYASMGISCGAFPITEELHREVLSLPMGPHLSGEQVTHVISAVRLAVGELAAVSPR